jgi:hypothetical protein
MSTAQGMAGDVGQTARQARFGLLPKAVALAGLGLLAACTSSQSTMDTAGEVLAPPQVVIVDTFAVSPDEVKVSEDLSEEVKKALDSGKTMSRSEQELETGHQVADALAHNLVIEIQDLGVAAERGSAVPAGTQTALLIQGQLVSIDEGNEAERVAIGLGAGRSSVQVHAQVYEVTPDGGQQLIDQIVVDGKSGLTPGMAETMGVGGLAGHLLVSAVVSGTVQTVSETMSATVVADADRAAKGIAKQLSALFAQQGWQKN